MCLKIRCILESSPMLRDEKVNDPLSSLQSVLIILKQLTFVLNYSGADVVVSSERRRRSREIWPLDGWGNCQILSRAVREVINPTFPFNLSNQLENHLRCHLQVWTWNPPLLKWKVNEALTRSKHVTQHKSPLRISVSRELFPSSPSIVHGLSIFHFHLDIRCEADPIHYGSWLFYHHSHAGFDRNSKVSSSANYVWGL